MLNFKFNKMYPIIIRNSFIQFKKICTVDEYV